MNTERCAVQAEASAGWSKRRSTLCTVLGAACLWAWGYVANLSQSLFPLVDVSDSIGIEFGYYASQLTLFLFGGVVVWLVRHRQPALAPAVVVGAAVLLAASGATLNLVLRLPSTPVAVVVACGIANGVAGLLLTVAWGARFSLGAHTMRRMVLLSFLLGYGIYLLVLVIPHTAQTVVAIALPLVSGGLWLFDSWRRHLLTAEVWPQSGRGEAAEGSTSVSILPWGTMGLLAIASFVGNYISSFVMGSSYVGAAVIFPTAFIVVAFITLAALLMVGTGARSLFVERLYRYDLPFAVLGMLAIMVVPPAWLGLPTAFVTGSSIFLQAIVILKVTEVTQDTGISPMLSFAVGQGLIGAVVFSGNVLGRLTSSLLETNPFWLSLVCGAGVFALFFLLTLMADGMAERAAATAASDEGEVEPTALPDEEPCAGQPSPTTDAHLGAFAAEMGLTARETDVLELLLRGYQLSTIADHLFVTTGTAKTHALHIYRKVGVNGKQELIDRFEADADR